MTRREILQNWGTGFGMLGLASLLADDAQAHSPFVKPEGVTSGASGGRLGAGAGKAKRVIFLFMSGGPSHVDTFDPKPRLTAETGKPLPFANP
jgi:Protein of unknown function (DUF1501)